MPDRNAPSVGWQCGRRWPATVPVHPDRAGCTIRHPKETRTMDETTFDALTRSVVTEAETRRAVVRLLVGTVFGTIASRLEVAEDAVAKAKPHRGKAKH